MVEEAVAAVVLAVFVVIVVVVIVVMLRPDGSCAEELVNHLMNGGVFAVERIWIHVEVRRYDTIYLPLSIYTLTRKIY